MKCISTLLCYSLIVMLLSGCVLEDNSKENEDKGTFTLTVSPLQFKSYPGGCGVVIISLKPDTTFAGDVDLSFETDENITLIPEKSVLSTDKLVEEIEVFPDSSITPDESQIIITYRHAEITDSKIVQITLTDLPDIFIPYVGFGKNLSDEIVNWLDETHPEYGINTDNSWFCFCEDVYTTGLIWRYFNQSWDIKITSNAYPPRYRWYLFRKRGDIEPLLCVRRDEQGIYTEIPVSDFGEIIYER
ncbi:hypothetical protein ACFL50_05445 [Candidatus Latescibacterota bacterium]